MNLIKNVNAPLFNLKDIFGRTVDLETYKDKKLLIGFFRHAGCPFCNLRVHELSKAYLDLKAIGFEMIFFFESKEKVILRSSFHLGVSPIPIISDPEKQWYDIYGLENSAVKSGVSHITSFVQTLVKAKSQALPASLPMNGESLSTLPAEFLIDRDLVIKDLYYSQRLDDRLDIETIKEFARAA